MPLRPVITLTTDFGSKDPFAGIMKGIILGINPEANIVDICHSIPPHDVFAASLAVSVSHTYFPGGSVHVVVVDPGVGGSRRPVLVATRDHFFLGPDNGVFSRIFRQYRNRFEVIHLSNKRYFRSCVSSTFHGRDIFAPVAAWLSRGVKGRELGRPVSDYVTLKIPGPEKTGRSGLRGKVVHIDRFGNAITNITGKDIDMILKGVHRGRLEVIYNDKHLVLSRFYEEDNKQGLSCLINSFEMLELFSYKGDASDRFSIKIGDVVTVRKR